MHSLLKMLPMMIRLSGDNEEVREQAVFAAWRAATGGKLDISCAPFRLYQRTLIVAIRDQMWKRQMEHESRGFIFKLNSLLGSPLVTYIEFRVDPHFVEQAQQRDAESFSFHHTSELEAELKPAAEQIRNDALRETFLRAAARCLERKESGR
ncbi:MAG TPA: DciA family protein [Blastocatellia bacterium]|nr:DciA family protein [Blastocatellia bacterium]